MSETVEEITVSQSDGIAIISLNRPHAKNAMSISANKKLFEIWEEVDSDKSISVIILTSSDCGCFCAGMDLKDSKRIQEESGKDILEVLKDPFYERMRSVTKPLIVAMTGDFFGAGILLAMNSDIRIGMAGTFGGISEAKYGRGTPWATPLLFMLPLGINLEMILTAATVPIDRLYQLGFVNHIEADPDSVRARAMSLAETIAGNAPLSVTIGKKGIMDAMELVDKTGRAHSKSLHTKVYSSEDAKEGPIAFAQRRQPRWKGV
mgnify:CR=1 FL=1